MGDGFGKVGKKPLHFGRRFEMTFGIARQQASGGIQIAMLANAGEDVQHFALVGSAWQTPLVASTGKDNLRAISSAAWLRASSSRQKCRCNSTYTFS